jgi:hypothetical protein
VSWNRYGARLRLVVVLTMIAPCPAQLPPVLFDHSDHVAHLHCYSRGKATLRLQRGDGLDYRVAVAEGLFA